jgi:hypothetical protein
MFRLVRVVLLACVIAALVPSTALAGARMYVGFQDDPRFRWVEDRIATLDKAKEANATVIRTTVYWHQIAPTRPAQAVNAFDPAYQFDDLDELVRNSQMRGMEVLLTIWGTPGWANGNKGRNRAPTNLTDLRAFATALSNRYSGRYRGLPYVRFYSVWNEPNLELFLAPQFNSKGKSVSPALYARLYRAAYAGIKSGNRQAKVAIGETSARGRDKPTKNPRQQDAHSPGKFAELLAKADRTLPFDAWAHHPYPTTPTMRPEQVVRWPNVSLTMLDRFGTALDTWFRRKNIAIWVTEYGHETSGGGRRGVSYATQASYVTRAINVARKTPRVGMFIWFVLRDHAGTPWQSGLLEENGAVKPSFARFAKLAKEVDARNSITAVRGTGPLVRVSALEIGYYAGVGSPIGLTYRVFDRGRLIEVAQPQVPMGIDGWFSFRTKFRPVAGRAYRVTVRAGDANGNAVDRTLTLVGPTAKKKAKRGSFRR